MTPDAYSHLALAALIVMLFAWTGRELVKNGGRDDGASCPADSRPSASDAAGTIDS